MINYCLFPVAGQGTRFLPITKSLPKEMLPIIDKPLLQYAVEEALLAGISNMVMITNKQKSAIEHYFCDPNPADRDNKLVSLKNIMENCQFFFTHQKEMKGLADAILQGKNTIKNNAFAVILPDDFCNANILRNMTELYNKYQKCIIAIEQIPINISNRYGIVKVADKLIDESVYEVLDLVEKPLAENSPSDLAIVGRYILTNDIFAHIEKTKSGKNNELQITDALVKKAHQGEVIAYKLPSKRYDCGTSNGYLEAIMAYSQK